MKKIPKVWSKQSSIASSTEPSSPAISESYSHYTASGEMSISLTSTEGFNILPAAEELARFFPQLDDDLNSVTVYTPMNMDTLDVEAGGAFCRSSSSERGEKSACLTPVSCGMDISMVANKGSMTISVDGFEDEDEATLSAATTPSLPADELRLETCYCCPTHAEQAEPPDIDINADDDGALSLAAPLIIPRTHVISSSPEHQPLLALSEGATFAAVAPKNPIRKTNDPISPKIQKQISLFEGGDYERQKEANNLHASINIPTALPQPLRQDVRLRKFENLTQSTSNSNFPFESNTLKRVQHRASEFVDVSHTQSCINLKTTAGVTAASSPADSPKHKSGAAAAATTDTAYSTAAVAAIPTTTAMTIGAESRPGALIVKEKFIEPPKRITRSFHGKTQSMDADFLCNEFLLVPARTPTHLPQSSSSGASSGASSASNSPTTRSATRLVATKIVDDLTPLGDVSDK